MLPDLLVELGIETNIGCALKTNISTNNPKAAGKENEEKAYQLLLGEFDDLLDSLWGSLLKLLAVDPLVQVDCVLARHNVGLYLRSVQVIV